MPTVQIRTATTTFPRAPPLAVPPGSNSTPHALHEADRLGLEITLNITSGWNLGGPDVTPDQASKLLTWTRTQVTGGTHVDIQLSAPTSSNNFYRQIAVLAYPLHHGAPLAKPFSGPNPPATQLSRRGDRLQHARFLRQMLTQRQTTPARQTPQQPTPTVEESVISQTTCTTTPSLGCSRRRLGDPAHRLHRLRRARLNFQRTWQGLAIDYMSRDAFDTYWTRTVDPSSTPQSPYSNSLKYLATDSWELGGTNWTQNFAEEFKSVAATIPSHGCPSSQAGSSETVTTARVFSLIFAAPSPILSSAITMTCLPNSRPTHRSVFKRKVAARTARPSTPRNVPPCRRSADRVLAPRTRIAAKTTSASSPRKQRARPTSMDKRFVAQEGETTIGPQWSESLPTDLKPSFDMAITEGMNRLVWHEFTSSPRHGLPGQEYFAGTHLNPKVTWWNAGDAFFFYLNRIQFLMQQGTPVDDVLYFYGDNVPNFVRLKADDPAHVLPGYDYDVTDEDALLHTIHLTGSSLTGPSGVTWRALHPSQNPQAIPLRTRAGRTRSPSRRHRHRLSRLSQRHA